MATVVMCYGGDDDGMSDYVAILHPRKDKDTIMRDIITITKMYRLNEIAVEYEEPWVPHSLILYYQDQGVPVENFYNWSDFNHTPSAKTFAFEPEHDLAIIFKHYDPEYTVKGWIPDVNTALFYGCFSSL